MSEAKAAVEKKGQHNSRKLRNLVVHAVQEAGGLVDYAEASSVFLVIVFLLFGLVALKKKTGTHVF